MFSGVRTDGGLPEVKSGTQGIGSCCELGETSAESLLGCVSSAGVGGPWLSQNMC